MASHRPDSRGGMDVPLYAPPREPGTRGAPQFVTTTTLEDEFSSVKIYESKGWRRMFPDIPENDGSRGFCGKFKFVIWAAIVIALVAGAIGLSIAMVIINEDRTDGSPVVPPGTLSPSNNNSPGKSPSPSPSPSPHTDQDGQLVIMKDPPFDVPSDWTALWWDEFDGNALDMKYWNYDIGYGKDYGLWAWGNQEQQYYTPENVKVADGFLTVTAQREVTELPDGFKFNYTSARINTKGKAGFFGGMTTADGRQWNTVRIEASIRAPEQTSVGLWAAYWFLPSDMRYGVWAGSGEMDLYEMKNEFFKCNFALHYGGPWPKSNRRYNLYYPRVGGGSFSKDFTTVALDWSTNKIEMLQNGEVQLSKQSRPQDPDGYYSDAIGATSGAPFNIPFYMIINLAVGGRYPGNATDETVLPAELTLDYIRVFGKN